MAAQLEGQTSNGENEFIQWLCSHGVKTKMIRKLTAEMSSVDELKEIEDGQVVNFAQELELTLFETNKFKYIVKKAKSDRSLNVIANEEQKALITMDRKIQSIEQSMQNIDEIQRGIDEQIANCSKQIEAAFFDAITALNKRKTTLINKLKQTANVYKQKLKNNNKQLNQQHSQSKKKLDSCHNLLRKPVEIQHMDQRKKVILNMAKDVNNINIPSIRPDEYKINISMDQSELIQIVNNFGEVSVATIPTPILLSIDSSTHPIKLQWKLQNYDENKQANNTNKKIKVEWTKLELKENDGIDGDADEKEMKVNFNKKEIFAVNNYNDNGNEILLNIGDAIGKYIFKLHYFASNSWSLPSNIKSIKYKKRYYEMRFDNTQKHGGDLQFIGDNIVKKINNDNHSICLFGNEINDTMCNQFKMSIQITNCPTNGAFQFFMGYITSTPDNSIKDWNYYLGNDPNQENSVGILVHSANNSFASFIKNKRTDLTNYKAPNKFKKNDTFMLFFNFESDELKVYHNGTESETLTLAGCKKFVPAFSIFYKDTEIKVLKCEFL